MLLNMISQCKPSTSGTALGYTDIILFLPAIAWQCQEQKKNKKASNQVIDRWMWKLSLTVTFCPFLSSWPSHNPSEEDSQPFLPRSLAQKPQQGRIRWWSYAKAKPESGSKEHFPQTANSWSRNKWECPAQRVGTGARQDHRALAPTRDAPDTALSSPWHPWCRHCAAPGPRRRENVWGL